MFKLLVFEPPFGRA